MQSTTTRTQQIIEQIKTLPTDSLNDLATYIDFLRFRASKTEDTERTDKPLRVVKLGGLLKDQGADVSPEALAEIRREMWRKFEDATL
jgi:hypothetical protein